MSDKTDGQPLDTIPEEESKVVVAGDSESIEENLDTLKDENGEEVDLPVEKLEDAEPLEIKIESGVDQEEISNKINALKSALIEEEPQSVHELHEELGMAGSRNAFPIEKEEKGAERLGQRTGMFIGIPNRHSRKHFKTKHEKPIGKGAVKIDANRPVNQ